MTLPLVSCVMATRDRRRFVAKSIEYFVRQDYAARELVVVDDGSEPVGDLVPDDAAFHYVRLPPGYPLGTKRNIGCEQARGDVVVHWDDDDWMAPWRLRYQVDCLLAQDADIVGLRALLHYDVTSGESWEYTYRGERPWVHDGTFCYGRDFWCATPFPDRGGPLATEYLWTGGLKRVQALSDIRCYVAIIHGANDSAKKATDSWWRLVSTPEVATLFGEDWQFYGASGS